MRGIECIGYLDSELEKPAHLQRTSCQVFDQRCPFKTFHHDEGPALVRAHVVDRADVGVVQRGGRPCLALEALERS
jgi:hypothetical protein